VLFPNRKTDRIIKGMRGRNDVYGSSPTAGLPENGLINKITVFIARFIKIHHKKREKVSAALERTGLNISVEVFYADAALKSSVFFICASVLIGSGVGFAAFASSVLGVLVFLKKIEELDTKQKRIKEEIADELPRFISVINFSLSTTRDLIKIFEKYLNICKPAFRHDLQLLIAEMKSGNYSEALKRFDLRIGIPQLSAFVSGLIDADKGIDQRTFFYLMEENMNTLFVENKKRELSKRPKKIKKAIISVGLCLFAMYIVPIAAQLIEGLDMFK
jgi:hypothetical protein